MAPAGSAPLGHPTAPGSSRRTSPAAPSTRSTPQTAATRRQSIRAGSSSSPAGSRAAPARARRTRGRRVHQLHAQQRWGSDVRAGHLPGTRREPGLTTNYTGMPCWVGGAFPSLPTRRICLSGTVIHESNPDKRTLGVLRPALPLHHLPTARRAAQAYVQRGAPGARQDLRPTWGHPSAEFPATAGSLRGFPADSRAGSARDEEKPAVDMSTTYTVLQG